MAAKKSAKKKKATGSVGLLNRNQRRQLEAIGDVKPSKPKSRGRKKK